MDVIVILAGAIVALFAFLFLPSMLELLYPEKDSHGQFENDLNQDPRADAFKLREHAPFKEGKTPLKGTINEPLQVQNDHIEIAVNTHSDESLYCQGTTQVGEKSRLRSLACDGDLTLGPFTRISDWVDAEGNLAIEHDVQIKNKATCSRTLTLGQNCTFKRLFGFPIQTYHRDALQESRQEMPHAKSTISQIALYVGYKLVSLPPGSKFNRDIVCKTDLEIGEGCEIEKNIKTNGRLILRQNVVVNGNLFSDLDIEIESGCVIHGSIFSQKNVIIHSGCRIGIPGKTKSLLGVEGVYLSSDVTIFGYVLTFGKGLVK